MKVIKRCLCFFDLDTMSQEFSTAMDIISSHHVIAAAILDRLVLRV